MARILFHFLIGLSTIHALIFTIAVSIRHSEDSKAKLLDLRAESVSHLHVLIAGATQILAAGYLMDCDF